jgi:hypothetical protein
LIKKKRKNKKRKKIKVVYQQPISEPTALNSDGSINEFYLTRGDVQQVKFNSDFEQ